MGHRTLEFDRPVPNFARSGATARVGAVCRLPSRCANQPVASYPFAVRAGTVQKHLQQLDGLVDRRAALDMWGRVLATPAWPGPPLWIDGDLLPGNLLSVRVVSRP